MKTSIRPTTLSELAWIHDCTLSKIKYISKVDDLPTIALSITCPADLGYSEWDGAELRILAIGVAASTCQTVAVTGRDSIDAVYPSVDSDLLESTTEARRMGDRFPDLRFSIAFHSGFRRFRLSAESFTSKVQTETLRTGGAGS